MRILRTAFLTVAGGVLMAVVVLGWNTATPHPKILGGPGVTITDEGGSNPWTGEVRPMLVVTPNYGAGGIITSTRTYEIPENWRDLRVVPVPVGFAVGSLLTLTFIIFVSRKVQPNFPLPAV